MEAEAEVPLVSQSAAAAPRKGPLPRFVYQLRDKLWVLLEDIFEVRIGQHGLQNGIEWPVCAELLS